GGWAGRLGSSPIVNVHLVFDRTVLAEPFVAGVGTPVQWVFDRTAQSGLAQSGLAQSGPARSGLTRSGLTRSGEAGGQYLAVSLSAADGLVNTPAARLRDLILPALRGLL